MIPVVNESTGDLIIERLIALNNVKGTGELTTTVVDSESLVEE